MVFIYKGDDVDFAGKGDISVSILSVMDITGFTGRFEFMGVVKDFSADLIAQKTFSFTYSSEETEKFCLGQNYGIFTLFDTKHRKAVVARILVEVLPASCCGSCGDNGIFISMTNNGSYNSLADKPSIDGVTIVGDKTAKDYGLATLGDVLDEQDRAIGREDEIEREIRELQSTFRGSFATWSDVPDDLAAYIGGEVDANDYIVVEDSSGYRANFLAAGEDSESSEDPRTIAGTWRFAYVGKWADEGKGGWHPEYEIGERDVVKTVPQELTAAEQAQARENIGLGNVLTDLANAQTTAEVAKATADNAKATADAANSAANVAIINAQNAKFVADLASQHADGAAALAQQTANNLAANYYTKEHVDAAIATSTARFLGTSDAPTQAAFEEWLESLAADNNDYVFWHTVDAAGNAVYKRYKYSDGAAWDSEDSESQEEPIAGHWLFEYELNNASFTEEQWAAINSGITSGEVERIAAIEPYSQLPSMDGIASTGNSDAYARGDHVHPTDISRASVEELNAKSFITSPGGDTVVSAVNGGSATITEKKGVAAVTFADGYSIVKGDVEYVAPIGGEAVEFYGPIRSTAVPQLKFWVPWEYRNVSNFAEDTACWYLAASFDDSVPIALEYAGAAAYTIGNWNSIPTLTIAAGTPTGTAPTITKRSGGDVVKVIATISDLSNKAEKASDASDGDIASLDANGNLKLSGMNRDANGNLNATEFTYTQSQVADYDSAAVGTTINKANTPVVLHSGEYWLIRKSFVKTSSGWSVDSVTGRIIKPGATGVGSTAWGEATAANGNGADSEGKNTRASGAGAHSEGQDTDATATCAHSEGLGTAASGPCAHTEGNGTKAQNLAEHAQGQYNASHTGSTNSEKTLHSIGIGTADNARKNAVEVMQDGKVFVNGVGGYDGTNPTSATDFAASVNGKLGKMEAIAWSDLKTLRDGGNLVPGQQYRITDYVATTNGDMESQSANHPFDIIVTADDERTLNEHARAVMHEGDLPDDIVDGETHTKYFAGCDLAAWDVWYCLDNDTSRFVWATANGKGVVYRLVDEFQNDVPYDFKGLQFKAYGDTDNVWRYTFDSGDASGNTDLSKSGLSQNVYKNTISPYSSGTRELNRIVFKGAGCYSNTFGSGCFSNTFGSGCYSNTFGNGCTYNTFGNGCTYNTFGDHCYSNTFGSGCFSNTFGNGYYSNTFGNSCFYNTFGNSCFYNTFGDRCYSNTFGNGCSYNTFGSGVIRAWFSYSSSYNAGTYFRIQGVVYRMVAPYKGSFSTAKQFEVDDRLYYATTSKYYKCVVAHQGAWNASHFEEVPQFGEGGVLVEDSTVVKSYYRYVTFQSGIQYVALNCPNVTSSAYYQNVELKSGIAGSAVDNPKLITDTNVNQDFHTTYKPANSQEISVP